MTRYIGIDIAKATLDADIAGMPIHLPNRKPGWSKLAKLLQPHDVIVLEASGGYERECARTLRAKGFAVAVVNPADAAWFRKGMGKQAKTDAVDAKALTHFGQARQLAGDPEPEHPQLADLVSRRHQIVAQRTAEKTRLEYASGATRASIRRMIACLDREVTRIEKLIQQQLAESEQLTRKAEILQSAPGVGPATCALLLAHMPELGTMSPREAASLAGLAPHPRESGAWKGTRRIGRGRAKVRRGLFMAVMGAMKGDNALRRMVAALKDAGKAPKQAVIAAARKLLTMLNAMLRDGVKYEEGRMGNLAYSVMAGGAGATRRPKAPPAMKR